MTAPHTSSNLDVQRELTKDLVVHQNVRQELIFTTVDKLKLCLIEHRALLASRTEWLGPLGLVVALGTTLVAATFKDFLLSAAEWKAFFVFCSLGSGAWTLVLVRRAYRGWKAGDIDALLTKITNKQAIPLPDQVYQRYLASLLKEFASRASEESPQASGAEGTDQPRQAS